MELVVPAGQDMATRADVERLEARIDGLATKEYGLRTLMLALLPVYIGMLGILGSVIGLYVTG